MNCARHLDSTLVASGKFIQLELLTYLDPEGKTRKWEAAERAGAGAKGAAFVIARLLPENALVLVRQYRPPARRQVVEFPAGLIDPGESPEATAVRELYEETGYRGRVVAVHAPSYSSPGMTGEFIVPVEMEITSADYAAGAPEPHPDPGEFIEVLKVPLAQLEDFLHRMERENTGVDSKLYVLAAALRFGRQ